VKPKLTSARKAALHALHRARETKTGARLHEALNRMEAAAPDRLAVPFKWCKANLAREAGVHVATIFARNDDRTYRWPAILDRFETLRLNARARRSDRKGVAETVAAVEQQLASAGSVALEREQELARQAELISELRSQLRDHEGRAAYTKEVMQANADLKAECRRLERLPR
jgi:hypothetical protein